MSIMDYSKYRYENFEGRPNVLVAYHLGQTYTSVKFNPLVLEVARAMMKKVPKNTYIFTGPSSNGEVANMYRCTVERDGEVLGILAYAQGRNGSSVLIENDRIRKERDRGGGMVTSDAKRATALALKKFLPTSPEESLLKDYSVMTDAVRDLINSSLAQRRNALSSSASKVMDYVGKNWATKGQALLQDIGMPVADIEALNSVIMNYEAHQSLRAKADKGLTFVMQKGDTFYTVPLRVSSYSVASDLHQRTFTLFDAPADMREKVAKLKVFEGDKYYEDVGYRLGENTYMIFFDLDAPLAKTEDDTEAN